MNFDNAYFDDPKDFDPRSEENHAIEQETFNTVKTDVINLQNSIEIQLIKN